MRRIGTVTLLALLAGCGGSTVVAQGDGGKPAIASDERPTGEWRTTTITEDPPAQAPLVKPDAFTLRFFDDGRVLAQARCNSISGQYRISDGRFRMDEAAQTEMGCPGDNRHEEDQWLSTFLTSGPDFEFANNRISLDSDTIQVELGPREEVQPNKPIVGTRWQLTHLTDGPAPGAPADPNSAVSASMAPPQTELTFDEDSVRGKSGCAEFAGRAKQMGDSIQFSAIKYSGCDHGSEPVGLQDVLAVLKGVVLVKIHVSTLTLTHSSGRGMQLRAAESND